MIPEAGRRVVSEHPAVTSIELIGSRARGDEVTRVVRTYAEAS